ncbi:sensory box histidine kinase/response regulator [Legionella santicrucis]|uniref:histidine kinase n=1 Tax=Legionella santicrucis TaxID=45074 RepID=A0A0W0Z3Q0_9GAMM|nr:MHYT domain-containing protein [Legionella santicrucis]KTD63739.1 sensory box histidine kinase/response regulator [Legionella santicrucis]
MLENYFQLTSSPANELFGNYDWRLVALSYIVAVFASYIALDFTDRLRDVGNTRFSSMLWLLGGSIAMGAGIWAMHFVGMLSFSIPGVTLRYDLFWTVISLLVAISASGFALFLLKRSILNAIHIIAGGVVLGLAIASMHYTGMEAMLISLDIRYLPNIFLISILIAIIASLAAILLAIQSSRSILRLRYRIKIISAIIMGVAISGMHYTAMAASIFTPLCEPVLNVSGGLDPALLSMAVASVTLLILCVAFFASSYKESLNQQQYERARELGMAEISSSVLHNVGNVLNSVNISADRLIETITGSPMIGIEKIAHLLNEHKEHLGEYVTQDPRGVYTLEFINQLADSYQTERTMIATELNDLKNSILLIKNIISTQQDLSRTIELSQMLSVNELLDEALLITGVNLKEIHVIKKYEKIKLGLFDKVKLLQLFVNLVQNAKNALLEAETKKKILTIKTRHMSSRTIAIEFSDTGIGIRPEHINRIFNFGFTTRENGHGFGLHTSALAIHDLGGKISVKSEGINQGATFIVELPLHV